jgi:butyryl-CoA dehydrogenase
VDTDFTPTQTALRDRVRAISETAIAPQATAIDRERRFPHAELDTLAKHGLLGMAVPAAQGGLGLDSLSCALVLEDIAGACASTATLLAQHNLVVSASIARFGNEAQKAAWLSDLAKGGKLGCLASAKWGAAQAPKARALREGDAWALTGPSLSVLGAPHATLALVLASTGDADALSVFLLPMNTPGVTIGDVRERLGLRGTATAQVAFDHVRLPNGALLGHEGQGRDILERTLAAANIGDASVAVGIAQAAFAAATRYATTAMVGSKPVADSQAVQFKLAEMSTDIDAARLLTWRAAVAHDAGSSATALAAMAKLMATEAADRVTSQAVEVLGEEGCLVELTVERHLRDAKTLEVHSGTNDALRLGIASALLKD